MSRHPVPAADEYLVNAEQMRALAAAARVPELRRQFLELAVGWEVSAERAKAAYPPRLALTESR